ncbi:hypothetical protein LZC95_44645 [Pendulispora brunnea]|uniref:Uncharacterized protein n=1 Tax=Pendulispora brunnea TaxID=2905690 RepID=A0ABZ2K8U8_9BACT
MRALAIRSSVLAAAMAVSIAACSGATGSELLEEPSQGASSNTPPGGGSGGGSDAGGNADAGLPLDSGKPDTGSLPTGVVCGDIENAPTYCNREREYCCVSTFMDSTLRSCMVRGLSLCGGVRVGCDSANDCAKGEVCCGVYSERTASYSTVECTPRRRCVGRPSQEEIYVLFCDPNAAENECADTGETCMRSRSIKGYFVCGK